MHLEVEITRCPTSTESSSSASAWAGSSTTTSPRWTAFASFSSRPRLWRLGHVRRRTHHGRAGIGRGGLIVSDIEAAHVELAGRGIDASEIWHGPPLPPRHGSSAPTRAHQLRLVLLLHRSGRQHVAGPGGHDAAPRPHPRHGHGIRVHGGPGQRTSACRGRPRRAPEAHRPHLLHRLDRDEDGPAWYAAYLVAEQAATDLPT